MAQKSKKPAKPFKDGAYSAVSEIDDKKRGEIGVQVTTGHLTDGQVTSAITATVTADTKFQGGDDQGYAIQDSVADQVKKFGQNARNVTVCTSGMAGDPAIIIAKQPTVGATRTAVENVATATGVRVDPNSCKM